MGRADGDFLPFDGYGQGDIFPNLSIIGDSYRNVDFQDYRNLSRENNILTFNLSELESHLITLQHSFNMVAQN